MGKPINQSLVGLRSFSKSDGIVVKSALYGTNCGPGNDQTSNLAADCNSKQQCDYNIDHNLIGDPYPGCPKTYTVEYQCFNDEVKSFTVSAEASGKIAHLYCSFLYSETDRLNGRVSSVEAKMKEDMIDKVGFNVWAGSVHSRFMSLAKFALLMCRAMDSKEYIDVCADICVDNNLGRSGYC